MHLETKARLAGTRGGGGGGGGGGALFAKRLIMQRDQSNQDGLIKEGLIKEGGWETSPPRRAELNGRRDLFPVCTVL